MSILNAFHEVRFPMDLALGATGGPERRTEIVTLGSGQEQRNSRWSESRRRFNAGYGIKSVSDLQTVIDFFEERRGRLFGFRFRDQLDWKSCKANAEVSAEDQFLGEADGIQRKFQLVKRYGSQEYGYTKKIAKPIEGSVVVSIDGSSVDPADYVLDHSNGMLTFNGNSIPVSGAEIFAGFEFEIPVRFDADEISVNLSHFEAGDIPSIPLVELLA